MGLDTVEMVIAVEDEFDIQISDAAASRMVEVRHLIDYVYHFIHNSFSDIENRLYGELEQDLYDLTGRRISDYPPDTLMIDLLTPGKENNQWRSLYLEPSLEKSKWAKVLQNISIWTTVFVFLLLGVLAHSVYFLIGLFVGPVLVWFLCEWLTDSYCFIPKNSVKISDLFWWQDVEPKHPRESCHTREEVFEIVAGIIVDQLGVKRGEVFENARFIEDLGVD